MRFFKDEFWNFQIFWVKKSSRNWSKVFNKLACCYFSSRHLTSEKNEQQNSFFQTFEKDREIRSLKRCKKLTLQLMQANKNPIINFYNVKATGIIICGIDRIWTYSFFVYVKRNFLKKHLLFKNQANKKSFSKELFLFFVLK